MTNQDQYNKYLKPKERENMNALNSSTGTTTAANQWSAPERVDIIENIDSIEFIYKETSMITYTSFTSTPPIERVFRIVFSCIDGKWNKSNKQYGEIFAATPEYYQFP